MESKRVSSRVRSILNYKKPAFWIILVALLAGIVTAVCFLTVPKKEKAEAEPEATAEPVDVPETVSVPDGEVLQWLDYYSASNQMPWEEYREIAIDAFPDVTFRWTSGTIEAIDVLSGVGRTDTLFTGMPIRNVFFADVTGDGKPELCATVSFGSGLIDEHIVVYDYANRQSYTLWDRGHYDYHISLVDGALHVTRTVFEPSFSFNDALLSSVVPTDGVLISREGTPVCLWSDGRETPLSRELHESDLLGEWLVEEERDADGNVLYANDLYLWKEFHFKEGGTVTYNETVPVSSDYEKAFGHPVDYRYEVYDNSVFIEDGRSCTGYYNAQTQTLELNWQTSPGQYVFAALRRMGADNEPIPGLCTVWQLTGIEAHDGSLGDPKTILIEQYLDFHADGTVHFIERNGENYSQATLPYAFDGNDVMIGEARFVYDPSDLTLTVSDPDSDDIVAWIYSRTPDAAVPIKEAALVGTWVVHSMDLDGTDVTNDEAYRKYRDIKIELYRSGKALVYGADERWNGSGFTWTANDEDGISDLAVTLRNEATGVGCSLAINGDYEFNDGLLSAFGDYFFFADADPELYMLFERDEMTLLPAASIAVPAGTDAPQTLEEILLGTYVCTGAEQNGQSVPIPAEYAGMTIDLGESSEGDTYKHTSTVTIEGEAMNGYGWTLDEDDLLMVWNLKTGGWMRFEWYPKQTACTTLKLTIDQAEPVTLIFTLEE